jgi:predicted acylesterase/phospholipase RssA
MTRLACKYLPHVLLSLAALSVVSRPVAAAAQSTTSSKPFKRALVMSGGGIKFFYFVGIYDALVDQGWKPDVVITTCGASVASALIQGFPDPKERYDFIHSPKMFALLKKYRVAQGDGKHLGNLLSHVNYYQSRWEQNDDVVPDLFSMALMKDEPVDEAFWRKSFDDRTSDQPHFVILGSQAQFTPRDVEHPRRGAKLYKEVFFTDRQVAPWIEGFESAIAAQFPNSTVASETLTHTEVSLGEATSISLRDPFLFQPIERDGVFYTGSMADLYPMELAHHLADEVVMTFQPAFNNFETPLFRVVIGYDMNTRLRSVTNGEVDHWIDTSAPKSSTFSMDPLFKTGFPFGVKVVDGLPEDEEVTTVSGYHYTIPAENEFARRVRAAYAWGYERGSEALTLSIHGSTDHIQRKTEGNFYGPQPETAEQRKKKSKSRLRVVKLQP